MQRQQSSAQDCPSSRKSPCFPCQPMPVPWCPGKGGFDGLRAALGEREMKDFCLLAVSSLLSSAGGRMGWEEMFGRFRQKEIPGKGGQEGIAPCIQSSGEQAGCATTLLPKANLKVTDFPLIFEKVKNSFFLTYYYLLPITAGVLRGSSWNQVLPMPGTAQPWGYKQPLPGFAALQDQTDPINISPAFQVGSCYIEGFQQELGNVSEVWLSSFLGLRSRIKLYLLLL